MIQIVLYPLTLLILSIALWPYQPLAVIGLWGAVLCGTAALFFDGKNVRRMHTYDPRDVPAPAHPIEDVDPEQFHDETDEPVEPDVVGRKGLRRPSLPRGWETAPEPEDLATVVDLDEYLKGRDAG